MRLVICGAGWTVPIRVLLLPRFPGGAGCGVVRARGGARTSASARASVKAVSLAGVRPEFRVSVRPEFQVSVRPVFRVSVRAVSLASVRTGVLVPTMTFPRPPDAPDSH